MAKGFTVKANNNLQVELGLNFNNSNLYTGLSWKVNKDFDLFASYNRVGEGTFQVLGNIKI